MSQPKLELENDDLQPSSVKSVKSKSSSESLKLSPVSKKLRAPSDAAIASDLAGPGMSIPDGNSSPFVNGRPPWVPDEDVDRCSSCQSSFGLINRRHHCRACGNIFCADCTSKKEELSELGYMGKQRVCKPCSQTIQEFRKRFPDSQNLGEQNDGVVDDSYSVQSSEVDAYSSVKKPGNASSQSLVILEDNLELMDKLGRPLGKFRFTLTRNSFRWNTLRGERREDYYVRSKDILTVDSPSSSEFAVHAFPWDNPETKSKRNYIEIRVKCNSDEEKSQWVEAIEDTLFPKLPFNKDNKRRLTVLINPFGGTKKAPQIWKDVEFIFNLVPVQVTVLETQYAGHAEEFANTVDCSTLDGIVTVSGDGLLHEVIQGLMKREDYLDAVKKVSVGLIPGGSGNGLATVIRGIDPLSAAFSICKGYLRPMDLIKVMQPNTYPRYSFLSINWGIISDVDFESEKYRFMGGARFTLGAIIRIADLRVYKGKITFLPAEGQPRQFCPHHEGSCNQCLTLEDRESLLEERQLGHISDDLEINEEWQTREGDFITITACNVSHISYDTHIAPFAHLSDGYIDLVIVKACPRSKLIQMFTGIETGEFVNESIFNSGKYVEFIKVKAFRLESLTQDIGSFNYDGERTASYEPVTAVTMRGILSLMG